MKCSRCDDVKTGAEIPALGHDHTVEVAETAKAATCLVAGKEADMKCSRCDDVKTGAEIPALGHNFQVVEGKKEATHTEFGYDAKKVCQTCYEVEYVNKVDPLAHQWSEAWTSDETAHWHECEVAGCPVTENAEKDGYAVHADLLNNETQEETPDQKCDVCGANMPAAEPGV